MAAPPRPLDESARRELRSRLLAAGFDEQGCAQRLSLRSARCLLQRAQIWGRAGAIARVKPIVGSGADPLDVLIALFIFGAPVPREAVEWAVGGQAGQALADSALVGLEGGTATGAALLFPFDGLYVATDRLDAGPSVNIVMPLFPQSYDFAALTLRRPVERALDLGTGCGLHALLAARHAREAVGVDISPRAIAFSEFNAWLNGVANVRWLLGDLYSPLPQGQRFGLLTANPPYNPEVDSAAGANYHSGGESGEELLSAIVAGLPERLEAGGTAQIITLLIHREGDPLEERVQGWLRRRDARAAFDVLVLASEVNYYRPLVRQAASPAGPAMQALQESWRQQRITRFDFGLMTFRAAPQGCAPVVVSGPFGDLTPLAERGGPSLGDLDAALDALGSGQPGRAGACVRGLLGDGLAP